MGIGGKQINAANEWLASIPNLLDGLYCKARELRKESPLFYVQGGVDAQVPKRIMVMKRHHWDAPGDPWGVATLLKSPSFDSDKMFPLVAIARHPGSEGWPMIYSCLYFPCPLDEMDAWVERELQDNPKVADIFEVPDEVKVLQLSRVARPRPRKQKPNEPCACGSGKKFKKCCQK